MAQAARPGSGNLVFVVALGVSALGHIGVLASRSNTAPRPIEDSATGWSGDEAAVQVFDAPSVAEEPRASEEAPGSAAQAGEDTPHATVPRAEPRKELPPAKPATAKLTKPTAAKRNAPPLPEHRTPSTTPAKRATPTDEPEPPATGEKASPNQRDEADLEEGVITPKESWRAPTGAPHVPSISGMPTELKPEAPAAPEETHLAPGVAHLETAFTRSVPYYNYADPAWDELPLGRVGSMKLTFVVDGSGQIVEATAEGAPPPVLERLRRRTVFGLRRGHFAITKSQVIAGRRTLRVDVFLEQRPVGSQALPAVGFRAPTNGRPGVATMHLESGRFVTVQVLPLDD